MPESRTMGGQVIHVPTPSVYLEVTARKKGTENSSKATRRKGWKCGNREKRGGFCVLEAQSFRLGKSGRRRRTHAPSMSKLKKLRELASGVLPGWMSCCERTEGRGNTQADKRTK